MCIIVHAEMGADPELRKAREPSVASAILVALGRRTRHLRRGLGWSRARLAERSGVSVRFLARVESGQGNISVLRLEALAAALGVMPDELLRPETSERPSIALVGLRGAGKSTVGPLLARSVDLPFVEMDERIVEASGLALDQLFDLHGERYYRRLEREALRAILARGSPAVVAMAGGVVNDPETWRLVLDRMTVVWLRATPEDHWNRLINQGDRRPMADHPDAMQELRTILAARERQYEQADVVVDTTDRTPQQVAAEIRAQLDGRRHPEARSGTVVP
jgi:XRE family aerobic/anaerobic benzoate catabolism transcriptional regulator